MSKQKTMGHSGKHKPEKGAATNRDAQPAASGELHQIAGGEHPAFTTNQALSISDNQNSLRLNPHGPKQLEVFIHRESIAH